MSAGAGAQALHGADRSSGLERERSGRAVAISRARDYSITYPVGHPLHGFVDYDIDAALDDQYNEQETTA